MAPEERQRRVTFVADELLGYAGNGIGTTTAFVSLALARVGYDVEVLFAGRARAASGDAQWHRLYDEAGVRVRELPAGDQKVEPPHFARSVDVDAVLRANPPDVVIVQDLGAPAYTALRLRRLGLAFERTFFVVFCHGTRQWITDVSRKARVLPGAHAVSVLERASVELADAVVSPSAYLVDWMRGEGWQLPAQTFVIPHVSRAGATGEPPATATLSSTDGVERLAFFGRLEERKGVRPFAAALNALEPELLARIEVEFLGRPTPPWPVERVQACSPTRTRDALRGLTFETALDQHEALARLGRPGTLAVVPSFEENSPNTIYECLENRVPFIASDAAGIRELVAPDDRPPVLFDPSPTESRRRFAHALTNGDALRPARAAFDDAESLRRWEDVLALPAHPPPPSGGPTRSGLTGSCSWEMTMRPTRRWSRRSSARSKFRARTSSPADSWSPRPSISFPASRARSDCLATATAPSRWSVARCSSRMPPIRAGRCSRSSASRARGSSPSRRRLCRARHRRPRLETHPGPRRCTCSSTSKGTAARSPFLAELLTRAPPAVRPGRQPRTQLRRAHGASPRTRWLAMTQRRITVVASELLGVAGTGGPGTADSLLAIALGRPGTTSSCSSPPAASQSTEPRMAADLRRRERARSPARVSRPVRPHFSRRAGCLRRSAWRPARRRRRGRLARARLRGASVAPGSVDAADTAFVVFATAQRESSPGPHESAGHRRPVRRGGGAASLHGARGRRRQPEPVAASTGCATTAGRCRARRK